VRAPLFASLGLVLSCGDASGLGEPGDTDGSGTSPSEPTAGDDGDDDTSGTAECGTPLVECAGTCVDPIHDPAHCGGCDMACAAGLSCIEGACAPACGATSMACGDGCADLDSDPDHCGACDHACPDGVPCIAGECSPTCTDDEVQCGDACVAIDRDETSCGACGSACGAGQPCVFGQCVDADVHHVLIGGQSLSVGYGANPVVSTSQPHDNVMFAPGVRAGAGPLDAFVPLVETQDGVLGETIASGMANLATELATSGGLPGQRILVSAHGSSGTAYAGLQKGTPPYAAGMAHAAASAAVATAAGETSIVRAVAVVHGESDHVGGNATYDDDLLEWQADYEADIQALTGQTAPVPMFLCQVSSFTQYGQSSSAIPGLQLAAARTRPDRIFVVGPKYIFAYGDGVHLTAESSRWLGEYYAKVYDRVLVQGERWLPLSPAEITRDGVDITIVFHVPAPPLVLDETLVSNPGSYGFGFTDSSGAPPAIASVALEGDVTVRVTLAAEPTAGNGRIRYAWTGTPGQPAGPMTGARGNLRDSDATPSPSGNTLYNWSVHFDEPVP
jgi:hypothetical protein